MLAGALSILSAVLLLGLVPAAARLAAPELESDTAQANAGFFRLVWQYRDAVSEFELQESVHDDFSNVHVIYRGPDRARVLSGRDDGLYFFRVRALDGDGDKGAWSAPVRVEVAHHSLFKAAFFFAVGALVFLSTLGLIVSGHLRCRQGHSVE
jgi:hypothetical protein